MNYYGAFRPSALNPLLRRINTYLMRWLMNKYKRVPDLEESHPGLGRRGGDLAAVLRPLGLGETGPPDDQDGKSRMTGDCHVRICGSPGGKFPGPPDHRRGWRLVLHPDGTTTAYGPDGQVLHSHSPPTLRAG